MFVFMSRRKYNELLKSHHEVCQLALEQAAAFDDYHAKVMEFAEAFKASNPEAFARYSNNIIPFKRKD